MEDHTREHAHLGKVGPAGGVIVLCLLAGFLAANWATAHSRRVERRHEDFVSARPPWHGRPWGRKDAVLYRDVEHPLTWHVCTEDGCGNYYEDGEGRK